MLNQSPYPRFEVPKIDSQRPNNDVQSQFLYELTVRVPFFVAIFKLFIDQLFDPPTTCGFIVVVGVFSRSKCLKSTPRGLIITVHI